LSIIQWYVGGTPTARSVVNEQTLPKIDVRWTPHEGDATDAHTSSKILYLRSTLSTSKSSSLCWYRIKRRDEAKIRHRFDLLPCKIWTRPIQVIAHRSSNRKVDKYSGCQRSGNCPLEHVNSCTHIRKKDSPHSH
jgi:hypothetical protein